MTSGALQDQYDAVVIGGGPAGLNGALMLARSRRSVVVIDAGQPRNAPAGAVHGLLGHDGTPPAELLATGRDEVRRYGGQIVSGEVVGAARDDDGFTVELADGRTARARRLLVTTGLVDELPDVPGLVEHWGHDVVHCPYCHGYEVRDHAIGILATSPMAVHHALLFRQLSEDLVFFANQVALPDEQREQLTALDIEIVDGRVVAVESADGRITGLRLEDGSVVARETVAVGTRMVARADFLTGLGLKPVEHPSGMGEHVPADQFGKTEVPGLWVAGNVTELHAQVGSSAAAGAMAGAQINAELVMEEAAAALAAS